MLTLYQTQFNSGNKEIKDTTSDIKALRVNGAKPKCERNDPVVRPVITDTLEAHRRGTRPAWEGPGRLPEESDT